MHLLFYGFNFPLNFASLPRFSLPHFRLFSRHVSSSSSHPEYHYSYLSSPFTLSFQAYLYMYCKYSHPILGLFKDFILFCIFCLVCVKF